MTQKYLETREIVAIIGQAPEGLGRTFLEFLAATGARVSEALLVGPEHLRGNGVDLPTLKRERGRRRVECPACARKVAVRLDAEAGQVVACKCGAELQVEQAELKEPSLSRFVALPEELLERVRALEVKGGRCFPRTRSWANRVIVEAGRAAGVPRDRCRPHAFRHAFAMRNLEGGARVNVVQYLMGHASLSTTSKYLQVVEARKWTPVPVAG